MTEAIKTRTDCRIPIGALAEALECTERFLRTVVVVLKIPMRNETLALKDAVLTIRYLATRATDQEDLLSTLIAKTTSSAKRELEFAVALEMVKQDRAALRRECLLLNEHLKREQMRGDRLEDNLHNLTISFAHIVSQRDRLVARSKLRSKTTLIEKNGRPVLYLEDPINLHLIE